MARSRFKRQESWRYKRLKESWRRPRGGTNRIRLEQSGWPRKPDIGLAKNSRTKGMHPSGLEEKMVRQARDLEGLDPAKHIVRLSHRLGEKKRLTILDTARQMNLTIANPGQGERGKPAAEGESRTKELASLPAETSLTEEPGEEEPIEAEQETASAESQEEKESSTTSKGQVEAEGDEKMVEEEAEE